MVWSEHGLVDFDGLVNRGLDDDDDDGALEAVVRVHAWIWWCLLCSWARSQAAMYVYSTMSNAYHGLALVKMGQRARLDGPASDLWPVASATSGCISLLMQFLARWALLRPPYRHNLAARTACNV